MMTIDEAREIERAWKAGGIPGDYWDREQMLAEALRAALAEVDRLNMPQVCCEDYEHCLQPCTPRGMFQERLKVDQLQNAVDRLINLRVVPDAETSLIRKVEQLQAENERLRKDAERYRWLRDSRGDICGTDEREDFDAAIDAAMERK